MKIRGLVVDDHKIFTESVHSELLPVPEQLVLSLREYNGSMAVPAVTTGSVLTSGARIAGPRGLFGINLHTPYDARVIEVNSDSIRLQVDHCDNSDKTPAPLKPPENQDELVTCLRENGVRGLGGGNFPTFMKFAQGKINTLIINAVECEPWITCDYRLAVEKSDELIEGLKLLLNVLKPERCLYAVEQGRQHFLQSKLPREVSWLEVPAIYPAGSERQLIQLAEDLKLTPEQKPAEAGIACINLGTLLAVFEAAFFDQPATRRLTTVAGDAILAGHNTWVPFGVSAGWLLESLLLSPGPESRLIAGGPMTGKEVSRHTILDAGTNCLLVMASQKKQEQSCIRCGDCAQVCPASLLPQQLFWHRHNLPRTRELNLDDCILCGACDYVCPSHIPLTNHFRGLKGQLSAERLQAEKAHHAEIRFDAKQARQKLRREQLIERKAQRQSAKSDLIKAALARKRGESS